jgi:hypothetical protein
MSEIIGLSVQLQADKAIESVGSIKKAMREAQKEVQVLSDKFGSTSKEAINAAKVAGELKDRIGDAKALTDAFNPDAKFRALTSSLAGVAGGFSALQGSMALFGSESEDVQKTLLKVQSAMAASQGLQAIGESIDSFKQLGAVIKTQVVTAFSTLRGAIIATGIGALAVGLGLIVANFEAVKKAVLSAIPGLQTFGNFVGKLVNQITDFVGVTSEASRALDKLKKDTKTNLDAANRFLDLNADKYDKYTQAKMNADVDYQKKKLDFLNDDKLTEQERNTFIGQAYEQRNRLIKNADKERADDLDKARQEEAKKAFERQLEVEAAQKAALDKEYQNELDAYNKRKALRGKEQQENIDAYATLSQQRAEQKAAEDKKAKDDADLLEQMRSSALGKMIEKNIAAGAAIVKTNEDTAKANVKIGEKEADAKTKSIEAVKLAITNLSMVAGKETVAGKALAIAASIINTYQGITAALKSAPVPFNFISAAAVGAAGFAAVKNIVSVQVPGSSGSGGASVPSAPNLNAGSPLTPTTIAANQVTLDQRSINAMGNRAIKAYVVETEISSAQQKIRRIQKQTTFG